MQELKLDVLVIGFGKAGKTIAMKRAASGDRVAIVEKSPEMYGGTCINIACIPTKKLLTEAARGVEYSQARVNRDAFIAKLNAANKALAEGKGVMIIDGVARFTGAHTVVVGDNHDGEQLVIEAETIVINTGAENRIKPSGKVHDSTSIQRLPKAPETLGVVGAGPIGLEFATMFNGFGTKVTVYNGGGSFLPMFDADIAEAVRSQLTVQGIEIVDEEVADFSLLPQEAVLVAIGRSPVVSGLGLEAAGIEFSARGIIVDEHCQTNIPGVYAVGDVNGGPQFTYISYDDHRVVLSHRWGDGSYTREGRIFPTTTFLNPPLSSIGMTESQAREVAEIEVKKANIADIPILPRPKILGQPEGVAKFILDAKTNQILGATLYCVDSQELINMVALAINNQIPAKRVGAGIYTHPATAELFNALLD
ncbi:MAG: FAD-dependent oxidoreductase [Arcanobacterium sp.]|nr:FAD-dependent oxidoreductase [Arcanobacterium sp.]